MKIMYNNESMEFDINVNYDIPYLERLSYEGVKNKGGTFFNEGCFDEDDKEHDFAIGEGWVAFRDMTDPSDAYYYVFATYKDDFEKANQVAFWQHYGSTSYNWTGLYYKKFAHLTWNFDNLKCFDWLMKDKKDSYDWLNDEDTPVINAKEILNTHLKFR